jgi:CBS domain-containing protein
MPKIPGMSSTGFREFTAETSPGVALSEMRGHGADYGIVFDHNGSPAMLLTLEDFSRAKKTGVKTMLHPHAKLPPTIVMPEKITIAEMLEHPAVTLLEHGARGAIVVHRNKVMGVVGADILMKALGSGSLSVGGRTMPFSISDSQLAGRPIQDRKLMGRVKAGFGNVMCKACGYVNRVHSLDRDHLPKCQNPNLPEHALKL